METNVATGTWTDYSTDISKEEKDVFNKALEGFTGVKYTPLAAATQVVAGINYRFFCNAKGAYPNALNESAMIQIYQPPNGIPHIISIKRCD